MKITVFNGSPHGENSNTHIMTKPFLEGAEQAGAQTEVVFLADKKINPCKGCLNCWTKTPGKCIHNDDMAELIPLMESDIVVFATPLYVDNVSGTMKMFFDRLVPMGDPHLEIGPDGETRHVNPSGKHGKFVIISNCGFPKQNHFQVLRLLFKRMAKNFNSEVIGEIYRSEGPLLSVSSLMLKPILMSYKKSLRQAGKEIVTDGKISEKTQTKLDKQLIPTEMYIKTTNQFFTSELKKIKS